MSPLVLLVWPLPSVEHGPLPGDAGPYGGSGDGGRVWGACGDGRRMADDRRVNDGVVL